MEDQQTILADHDRQFSWHDYNESQTKEKSLFVVLLKDLCMLIEEPNHERGRKPHQIKDIVYSICLKTYLNTSSRRVHSDLRLAKEQGHVSKAISFNSLLENLERAELKEVLRELIEISAIPLKQIEADFAIDATGFSTSRYKTYAEDKWVHRLSRKTKLYRKCHAVCGVKTNVITSIEVTKGTVHDTTQFEKLSNDTKRKFKIRNFLGDKGYQSKKNINIIRDLGGTAIIPFKKNQTGKCHHKGDNFTYKKLFNFFHTNKEAFMHLYHKRSNVESCFSMIKRKFGNNIKCKKEISQDNEILAKVLVHNICVLIQEIFLNKIYINFNSCAKSYVARK